MINAADSDLDAASSSCERWGLGGAGLVVLAVIAELVIAWVEPPYNAFLADSAVADGIIALGITVEVVLGTMWNNHIQTELRRRSNQKVVDAENTAMLALFSSESSEERAAEANKRAAEANQRAAEATLETERLKERMASRALSPEQQQAIANELSAFKGTRIYLVAAPSTSETEVCKRLLWYVFEKAGWDVVGEGSLSTPLVIIPTGIIIQWFVPNGEKPWEGPDAKAAF